MFKNLKKLFFAGASIFIAWLLGKILDASGLFEYLSRSIANSKSAGTFLEFLSTPIPLWKVIIYLILLVASIILVRFLFKKYLGRSAKNVRKREQLINEIINDNVRVLPKDEIEIHYEVSIDDYDGKISVNELVPYCRRHDGLPIKMVDTYVGDSRCPLPNCDKKIFLNFSGLKAIIESELEHKWKKTLKNLED